MKSPNILTKKINQMVNINTNYWYSVDQFSKIYNRSFAQWKQKYFCSFRKSFSNCEL